MKKKKNYFHLLLSICLLCGGITSCTSSKDISKNYVYFQSGIDTAIAAQKERVVQINDQLFIQVYSKTTNQEQAAIFNLTSYTGGSTSTGTSAVPGQGYQVHKDGTIEIPVIGYLRVMGLTRYELEKMLIERLKEYVKNPLVIVRFLQFNVNVLGEVRVPGTKNFLVDKVTVIDALSAAGDLTDFGRRENITVIREEAGKRNYYALDLRSKDLFQSPGYSLQPNDIIYVSPNNTKLKSLNIDPEAQRKTGLFFTIASAVISVTTLIITSVK
jgi:polysaccharide export outer membrane protein